MAPTVVLTRETEGVVSTYFATEFSSEAAVVRLTGELDLADKEHVADCLSIAIEQNPHVVVDMTTVTFIDSTALGLLATTHVQCAQAGGSLTLIIEPGRVMRALELSGLDQVLSIARSAYPHGSTRQT